MNGKQRTAGLRRWGRDRKRTNRGFGSEGFKNVFTLIFHSFIYFYFYFYYYYSVI